MATILMIFLRVLSKNFLWPHYSGPQELGGPGSLNRLNPRFLCHWIWLPLNYANCGFVWSIGHLWLPINAPWYLWATYRFRDKGHSRIFKPPIMGFPWNFVTTVGLRKLEWCPYQTVKKWQYVHSFTHSTGIEQTDGRRDRRIELVKQYRALHVDMR